MKAVIDEDLPRSFATILSSLGFIVFDIRDHDLRGKSDDDIFAFANKYKAVLFSGDLDFANTLRFPLGSHFGIVILRFPNEMSVKTINEEARLLLSKLIAKDYKGNLIILSPRRIRIRQRKNN